MSAETIQLATQALAIPVSAGIFLNGIEELMIDAQYFGRGLYRREHRAITAEELAAAPPQRIAIMVAAWHEADVIENMLEHNRRNLDYDPALYDIFCGTYQNDPDTQDRVDAVAGRYTNIHKVVVGHDGPTSKADCLNWIYQGIVREEKQRGHRFDILLMHDAEDIIHPLALRLYCLEIPKYEFVQTPVFSLPLRHRDVISSTYIDEFAEHHLKDMLVREAMRGLVPSAGVGSAFARDAFEEIARANDQHPFNVDSLTEDYEVGLKFRLADKRFHFACRSLQKARTVKRTFGRGDKTVVDEEYIATREYFPNSIGSSVRQRARWITGIALQTWGQIGWQGPAAVRYSLWRDRKVVATNSFLLGAYLIVAMMGTVAATSPATLATVVPPHTLLWWLMGFNLFLLAWRATMKINFVGRLYGLGHAVLSVPRLILANVIGLAATVRAVRLYFHHLWTGQPLRWAKTAHEFPSVELLELQRQRLGEFLVAHNNLTPNDVEAALRIQEGTDLAFGEVVAGSGMMSARAITEALGTNLSIQYVEPNAGDVPAALLRALPEALAAELEATPVAFSSDGQPVVAMAREPWPQETQELEAALGCPVKVVLGEAEAIRRCRRHAYRRLVEGDSPHERLGEALLNAGVLDLAQLYAALEEQIDTGERLGELLVRQGTATPEQVARALWAPREPYRSIDAEDIDRDALRKLGYGFATLYQLAPLRTLRGMVLACPAPIHRLVQAEVERRLGVVVEPVLASSLEINIALVIASRTAWPTGVALRIPGVAGAEVESLLAAPDLRDEALTFLRAAKVLGASPIEYLAANGRIDRVQAGRLHASAFGLDVIAAHETSDPGTLLPPELVAEHGIRLCVSDAHGLVLAATHPTPHLVHQIADLFVRHAVTWRVLNESGRRTVAPQAHSPVSLKEAV